MKNLLICIMLSIGLLISPPVYSATKHHIASSLANIDQAEVIVVNGKYEFSFEAVLNENEKLYKNNIIMFIIDDTPFMFTFDLFIRLSNNGVEEKAVVIVPRSLLVKIASSDVAAVKLGGTRNTIIDENYKNLLVNLLGKTK